MKIRKLGCSRLLFIAELALFILPTIAVLARYFLFFAFLSFGGVIVSIVATLTSAGEAGLDMLPTALLMAAICICTLAAVWEFGTLSYAYLKRRTEEPGPWRRKFWRGLLLAIPPLGFSGLMAVSELRHPEISRLWVFYLSGMAFLVPVVHLWFATRRTDGCDDRG